MNRPTLFIGSSSAGLPVAEALQENLLSAFEVEIWNQGSFEIGDFNLEALVNNGRRFDFAVLVVTPDDLIVTNNISRPSPRDNVIFEMGFFLAILGRKQAFIVHEKNSNLKLPTDIDGLNCATYINPGRGNLNGALGGACTKIKTAASKKTEDSFLAKQQEKERVINKFVNDELKLICTALCAPKSAGEARLRAFVFKKEGSSLLCTHFWSPNPVKEVVGDLMFGINSETEKQVAVVKAAIRRKVCAAPISVLPDELEGVHGEIEKDLCFVLASPILGPNGEVWGTVDFDASSKIGEEILLQDISQSILFELGKQLYTVLATGF